MDLFVTGLEFIEEETLFEHLQNLDKRQHALFTRKLRDSFDCPIVFLLTCDRYEIYTFAKPYPAEKAERTLSLNPLSVKKYRYSISGIEALEHIFHLSSGIISPLFGEDTIISQLVNAIDVSRMEGSSSAKLEKLFNMAIAFGKKCQSTFKLRAYESVLGDRLLNLAEGLGAILIVGSGEWARCIAKTLSLSHEVYMTLRDEEKIFLLPPGVKAVAYDNRRDIVSKVDAIISSSSGLYHTFDRADKSLFNSKLLVDLASPYDIPDELEPMRLEDLGIVLEKREENIKNVSELAKDEIAIYSKWLSSSESADQVASDAIDLANEVLRRLRGPVSSLSSTVEEKESLQSAIYETVRKAYIGSVLSKKQ